MTHITQAKARKLADDIELGRPVYNIADALRSLADQVEALTADRDSWANQVSDRIDDALKFAAERDALKADAARYRWLRDTCDRSSFHLGDECPTYFNAAIDKAMKDQK